MIGQKHVSKTFLVQTNCFLGSSYIFNRQLMTSYRAIPLEFGLTGESKFNRHEKINTNKMNFMN